MIPADHWHDNGDGTAWWVVKPPLHGPGMWQRLDRPCDTCDGEGVEFAGDEDDIGDACPACDGTGRHAFTVGVASYRFNGGNPGWFVQDTLRVSVVPGMVLPIWAASHADGVHGPHICIQPGPRFTVHTWDGWEPATLPPAAAPGMHAVLLAVHQ
jgi:hypothetical protein